MVRRSQPADRVLFLDDTRDAASQSIDFPPVVLATLLGIAFARKFLRRHAPRTAAPA